MSEWPQEAGSPRWVFFPEGSRRTALEGHGPHNKLALLHVSHCPGGALWSVRVRLCRLNRHKALRVSSPVFVSCLSQCPLKLGATPFPFTQGPGRRQLR